MTPEEAAMYADTSPEALIAYFSSPAGQAALAAQQQGVQQWQDAGGFTGDNSWIANPSTAAALLMPLAGLYTGYGGFGFGSAPEAATAPVGGDLGSGGGSGSGSASGGVGDGSATISPYPQVGAGSITGTPIDVSGNAIGSASQFGTSSIPFDGSLTTAPVGATNGTSPFSGGADPNAPPAQAPPGAQTPGGYDLPSGTQIPNLPGANMASSLPSWLQSLLPYSGLIGAGLGLVDSALQPDHTTSSAGGTSNSTNSSTLQLPSQLTGAAGTALDKANQLLTQGQQFAPTPYLLNHAADQLNNLGSNTAPTTSSFASGANINPYLDLTFNTAADSTQNRLASEFANAGQFGSPQNQQARSQELQTLAAGIYGPGYQNAQNLQYGAQEAGVSRGLQQQDSNLNRTLAGAQAALPLGSYMQQQQQAQLNGPQTSLGQYIAQLGGLSPYFPGTATQTQATNQTGNVTQPLYNNPITSAVGGAITGNYFGNMIGGQPQQQGQSYGQTPINRAQAQNVDFRTQMPISDPNYVSPFGAGPYGAPAGTPSQQLQGSTYAGPWNPASGAFNGSAQTLGGNLSGINNLYSGIGTQQPLNAGFGGLNYGQYAY